jgi:serine/threonine-protein kinase SIK3
MKIVDKRSLDAENLTKIEREIEVLQKLRHPFIVKLYEVRVILGFNSFDLE